MRAIAYLLSKVRGAWAGWPRLPKVRWPLDYRFFDFNDDGLTDIVPEYFLLREEDVIAWLGDGVWFFCSFRAKWC